MAQLVAQKTSKTDAAHGGNSWNREWPITEAGSDQSKKWTGWGTALKPAFEPICLARKPIEKGLTIAENLKKWGTGAINIDGCRVPGEPWRYGNQPKLNGERYQPGQITPLERYAENITGGENGRWPANLIHDGSEEVVSMFPDSDGQQGDVSGEEPSKTMGQNGIYHPMERQGFNARNDSGSAARFFYCAKTSRADRNEGCESFVKKPMIWTESSNPEQYDRTQPSPNNHPTVKPTELMRYLCRLVTPKGGLVLDPFMGSGSTGKAAMYEHMRFVGIDKEFDLAIAKARIEFALRNRDNQIDLFA